MSIKKLIENLEEWHENAISELCADDQLSCDDLCGCRGDCIVLQAIKALQVLADQEDPTPLTLDELRQMDGEPVWIKADHYGLYADVVHIVGKDEGEARVRFKINWHLQENGYNKTWLAFLHKPKED